MSTMQIDITKNTSWIDSNNNFNTILIKPTNWNELFNDIDLTDIEIFLKDRLNKIGYCCEIFPPKNDVFNAFKITSPDKLRVVILGQDPYINYGEAMGLAFSVPNGVKIPPSLRNIFKKLGKYTKGVKNGDLTHWAEQGVLLLNATLTVEQGQANAHATWGWQQFTDKVVHLLNDHPKPIVFLLWGAFAAKKCAMIKNSKHLILTAPHPSPLSAHRGFIGCGHFSQANQFLKQHFPRTSPLRDRL